MANQEIDITRRDFLRITTQAGASFGVVAVAGGLAALAGKAQEKAQYPEASPTPDQYAESDAEDVRKLTAINRREGQTILEKPRIIGFLEYRDDLPLAPEQLEFTKFRAVLATGQGGVYGFASNIACILPYVEEYLGDRMPMSDTRTEKDRYYYPLSSDFRLGATTGRVLEDEEHDFGDNIIKASHYALDDITVNGQTTDCPDRLDKTKSTLRELGQEAKEFLGEARQAAGELFDKSKDTAGNLAATAESKLGNWIDRFRNR
jgi:hypothetical protein